VAVDEEADKAEGLPEVATGGGPVVLANTTQPVRGAATATGEDARLATGVVRRDATADRRATVAEVTKIAQSDCKIYSI
jgi:hypothetical protein